MASDTIMAINRLGFADSEMQDFAYLRTLAYADFGAASVGEVVHVARKIARDGGGRDAFIEAWSEQGRLAARTADDALAAGRPRTARTFLHRAYNYLRTAEFYFNRRQNEEFTALYDQSVSHFDRALPLLDTPAERIAIPYQDGIDLPGYFFASDDSGTPRPTVVISGGGDGHGEELYFLAGVPHALARGLNVVLFHGPGQRGLLHHHPDQVFRADSEVPFAAVLDHVTARPDVRADAVALYGLSFGGYLAPRAAAHDRRVAALVANAPIIDFHSLIFDALTSALPAPPPATAPAEYWNGLYQQVGGTDWALQATMDNYMLWTTGARTFADFHRLARSFTLDGLVSQITCPTLTLSSDGENAVARDQARRFHEQLVVPVKAFHRLAAEHGADSHCGLSNIALTSSLVYDWLTDVLAAPA
ncbi:alpha/beta hydrolase family protein [Nonomuraea pusilla]|uniref:Alpha/beta hydrolase family protein n=1 Tax=Nonomuraea pusilla TaxID=46177 RepID=A0A1H8A1K1_9ACTN|nr:prolyl oligopeptidase family serine peptidase [Nonomuraea pusilla]SEM63708.1 Alpha/beta hydrolase family protein [Nonomuraea pusilla]